MVYIPQSITTRWFYEYIILLLYMDKVVYELKELEVDVVVELEIEVDIEVGVIVGKRA